MPFLATHRSEPAGKGHDKPSWMWAARAAASTSQDFVAAAGQSGLFVSIVDVEQETFLVKTEIIERIWSNDRRRRIGQHDEDRPSSGCLVREAQQEADDRPILPRRGADEADALPRRNADVETPRGRAACPG